MPENQFFSDAHLGKVLVRRNVRARRFVFRVKEGLLVATLPLGATEVELREVIEGMRPRLQAMLQRAPQPHSLVPGFRVDSECFMFWFEESDVRRMGFRERKGELVCHYPKGYDFSILQVQEVVRHAIEESLRRHARVLFAPRLKAMAELRGLTYQTLRIHKTKSRWGSCSSKGCINLSLYLVLLPVHLQDYVMQHELTHLQEMNHGVRFHRLLDAAVDGKSRSLEKELKACKVCLML